MSSPLRADATFQIPGDDGSPDLDKARGAVVKVRSDSNGFTLAGSGFFIDDHGTVLTASTVVGDNPIATVVLNGVGMDAQVIGNDPRSGLAMLRVSYNEVPFLPLARTADLKSGYPVQTVGYPLSLPVATGQGPVSGFDINYLDRYFATTHIHANISLSPGQIGEPLLNSRREVVGLVVASPDDGRSLYALPVEAMQKIMADFNQYGHARHGWAGVDVVAGADVQHDGRIVRVLRIRADAPASRSGIQPGDTLMRIDSREIYRPADVLDASFFSHVGDDMNVVVRRNSALFSYTFTVIERPTGPAHAAPMTGAAGAPHPLVVTRMVPGPR